MSIVSEVLIVLSPKLKISLSTELFWLAPRVLSGAEHFVETKRVLKVPNGTEVAN